ncbi:MAG: nucleotidyltransferase domain-containing protein, partial [Polynucleobacter sp.]|nr:nucleotidyltransferase domain-containing protein [Polynucleobacter sp.]
MHDYEKVLNKAKTFTRQKLERVRAAASKLDLYGCEIVIIGSYARQEASAQSDFDYFILHPPGISTK